MQADRSTQRAITRLCIQCGLFLLQHGAESALVEELSTRLGLALGMDSVESAISSNAIVLTTIKDGQCLTSTRKNHDRGINMHVVTEVQHIVILAEHKLLDLREIEKRFSQIKPLRYPRWLVVVMVGLSCACFCKLNKGGWDGAIVTFFASSIAMYVRQLLTHRQLHPQINFCITAFVATTVSGLLLRLPQLANTPTIAMATPSSTSDNPVWRRREGNCASVLMNIIASLPCDLHPPRWTRLARVSWALRPSPWRCRAAGY